ncbi:MAG: aminotransferase class I/II-fold pyridoxal phosphate-dependent enzyme [Clostridiales bacterium]|nr:aminotransferase class I/II-fold pyridoxal phosphate-dependent enzyme [Clostridiales bacterium]
MLVFENDYSFGAHPKVLEELCKTNMAAASGYGSDGFTASAMEKIRKAIDCPDAQICFLTGGTQTNQVVIDCLLKPYEGVISCVTGHVNGHEAGAIEHSGHKVLALPHHEGKLRAEDIRQYIDGFYGEEAFEHMVFPGMVYISHPTEYGTLYSKQELEELRAVCDQYHIPLYMDGARLAYGLMSERTDVTLQDIARLTDVFYIGGTKCGALCGEALVFTKRNMPDHFLARIKQKGALLAKGRLNAVQFDALFTDNLYEEVGAHAIRMAALLKKAFADKGYPFHMDSPTNQQFVILTDEQMQRIAHHAVFSRWEKLPDGRTVVRFATSWATTKEDIRALSEIL